MQIALTKTRDRIKAGDIVAFTYWGKVLDVDNTKPEVKVRDLDTGLDFFVSGQNLIELSDSADFAGSVESVTKSQAVEILSLCHNKPFTVIFIKKDGTKRKLRGRLIGIDKKNLGYIDVEDLDQPVGERFRLVDCRTIESIVVDNVKYVV